MDNIIDRIIPPKIDDVIIPKMNDKIIPLKILLPEKIYDKSDVIIIDDIKYNISDLKLFTSHNTNIYCIPGNNKYVIKEFEKDKFEEYKKIFIVLCDKNFQRKQSVINFMFPQEGSRPNMIIMEQYDGDLYKLFIDLRIKLESFQIINIIEQIIMHTKYLFEKKLYYTDIKMENILYKKNKDGQYNITYGDIDSIFDANNQEDNRYRINISYGHFFHLLDIYAMDYEIYEIEQIVIYSMGVTILKIFIYGFYNGNNETMHALKYNIECINKKNIENRRLLWQYYNVPTLYEKSMIKFKIDTNKLYVTKKINDIITYGLVCEKKNKLLQNCFKIFSLCVLSVINGVNINDMIFDELLQINITI